MDDPLKAVLSDKTVVPDNDLVFSVIGNNSEQWIHIMDYLGDNHKGMSGSWNYYNDGKQWLYKMVYKKKTVFWLSLIPGTFRITFYFGDKAEPLINESNLPVHIKESFLTAHKYGKIRPVTIIVTCNDDAGIVLKLVDIKLAC